MLIALLFLPILHSAEPGGSRCGAQRQPGGGNGSAVFAVIFTESDRWRGSQRPLSDGNGHTAVYSGRPAVVTAGGLSSHSRFNHDGIVLGRAFENRV